MAKKSSARKKKKFAVRFELGLGGLLGLATITFCIFLWLFLLGVWAGQTVLLPSGAGETARAVSRFSEKLWAQGQGSDRPEKALPTRALVPKEGKKAKAVDEEEPSFFTLQMGAYESEDGARQEMLNWQARGEDAFFSEPPAGSGLFRVFLGRYETLAAADAKVEELEEMEDLQAFITLLPAAGNK